MLFNEIDNFIEVYNNSVIELIQCFGTSFFGRIDHLASSVIKFRPKNSVPKHCIRSITYKYPIYPSWSIGTSPLVRFICTCAEYTESSYDKHTITTEIRPDYYIYTLERSICLIINIMINIRYIPRCVIQISNSAWVTIHAVSLDFRYHCVSFKRPLRSVLLTDARARWHCERLPLIIHVLSWLRQSDTSQSNTQRRTNITIRARSPSIYIYIHQMSQYCDMLVYYAEY